MKLIDYKKSGKKSRLTAEWGTNPTYFNYGIKQNYTEGKDYMSDFSLYMQSCSHVFDKYTTNQKF